MPGMTVYEIWVVTSTGEYPLVSVMDDLGLTDAQAKTAAQALAQEIITKITTPAPDTIVVRKGLIAPSEHHTRFWKHQNNTP